MIQCALKIKWKGKSSRAKKTFFKKNIRNLMKIYLKYKDYYIFSFKLQWS